MPNVIRSAIALALLVSFLVANPRCVFACSCLAPGTPAEELASSTAVFAGRVVDLDVPGGATISSADPVRVTFQVSQVWKGPAQQTLVVTTPRDSASCGVGFEQGQEYMVYARSMEGELTATLCSRTQRLSDAGSDLAALGEGQRPTGTAPGTGSQTPPALPEAGTPGLLRSYLIGGIVAGGLGLGLLLVATRAIRKRAAGRTP